MKGVSTVYISDGGEEQVLAGHLSPCSLFSTVS